MLSHALAGVTWFFKLFDPPPLDSMDWRQKIGRVFLVTVALVTMCILLAMLAAVVIYIEERGRLMLCNTPHLLQGLVIIFVGLGVNAVCVMVLLMVRRVDGKLMPPS